MQHLGCGANDYECKKTLYVEQPKADRRPGLRVIWPARLGDKDRGGGYIVSLTSDGSQRVVPGYIVTGASKAAIDTIFFFRSIIS